MRKSNSQIFNNLEKTQINILNTGFSIINTNDSTSKKISNCYMSIKFPKILLKVKYNRNPNLKNIKYNTRYSDNNNYLHNNNKKSLKDSFNIYHYNKIEDKKSINDSILFSSRSTKEFTKDNEMISPMKSLSVFYKRYKELKSRNYYDTIFVNKGKMTDYKKCLSSEYKKNIKNILGKISYRFKQRNDSLLNMVDEKDGFYIKGLKYKKYYFYPHKKVNILSFHNNIMNKNIQLINQNIKKQNLKKIIKEKKINYRNSSNIDNDNFLTVYQRNNKRHWTKNCFIRKKMKQKVEEIIDDEINNVLKQSKLKY